MPLFETVRILEKLVGIPNYWIVGTSAGERIIYFSNEGGPYALWSIDFSGSKKKLTSSRLQFTQGNNVARPIETSTKIVFARDTAKGAELFHLFSVDTEKADQEETQLSTGNPMRILGLAMLSEKQIGYVGATMEDLSVYLLDDGHQDRMAKLTGLGGVSDANSIYIVGSGYLNGDPKSQELFIFETGIRQLHIYTPKQGSVNKDPKLNGSKLLFESNFEGKNSLYTYEIETRELLHPHFSGSDYLRYSPIENIFFGWFTNQSNKDLIWSVGKRDGEVKLFFDGHILRTPQGFINGVTFVGSTAYYSHCTLASPPKILRTEVSATESSVVVDNPLPLEIEQSLGKAYFAKYKASDGWDIPAFVLKSGTNSKAGRSVIYIHGGPASEVANSWSALIACFVISGYNVIAPNFRGSTGYGEEFRNANVGDLGGADLSDMVRAAIWAKEMNLGERFAIVGYSYGGFSTLLALGKYPDLWSCGVAGAAIADWEEMYGLSDAAFKNIMDTLFDCKKELLKDRSPSTYVQNVKVPLCILQSQNDTRTPLSPVLKYALKLPKGVPFEMHVKPDLGHAMSSAEDLLNILEPAASFLDQYFT
jgi:dipeptidyl aminopeptidase/acylaminoacyl peptidase